MSNVQLLENHNESMNRRSSKFRVGSTLFECSVKTSSINHDQDYNTYVYDKQLSEYSGVLTTSQCHHSQCKSWHDVDLTKLPSQYLSVYLDIVREGLYTINANYCLIIYIFYYNIVRRKMCCIFSNMIKVYQN